MIISHTHRVFPNEFFTITCQRRDKDTCSATQVSIAFNLSDMEPCETVGNRINSLYNDFNAKYAHLKLPRLNNGTDLVKFYNKAEPIFTKARQNKPAGKLVAD